MSSTSRCCSLPTIWASWPNFATRSASSTPGKPSKPALSTLCLKRRPTPIPRHCWPAIRNARRSSSASRVLCRLLCVCRRAAASRPAAATRSRLCATALRPPRSEPIRCRRPLHPIGMSSEPLLELRELSVLLGGSRTWLRKPVAAGARPSMTSACPSGLAKSSASSANPAAARPRLAAPFSACSAKLGGEILLDGRHVSGLVATSGPQGPGGYPICASGCRSRAGSLVEHRRHACEKGC